MERFFYDVAGNRIKHVLPEQYEKAEDDGKGWYYTYDLRGRLTGELVPVGEDAESASYRQTSYEYDDNGNRIREVRYGGNYGADGELLRAGEPDPDLCL